ncbi:hypothetical protein KY338_01695 [Candidatus Woesearchaeota archaeon]|nr:hypothetical protein [Candidatus Woesearchaeota archaeon]MBW3005625.1 hypothetical protein [Candidatus Woesearchaeota archaeon]
MAKNNIMKFTVTPDQKKQIELRAKINGYNSIASYIRDLALNNDFLIKFNQMYNKIMNNEIQKRKNS